MSQKISIQFQMQLIQINTTGLFPHHKNEVLPFFNLLKIGLTHLLSEVPFQRGAHTFFECTFSGQEATNGGALLIQATPTGNIIKCSVYLFSTSVLHDGTGSGGRIYSSLMALTNQQCSFIECETGFPCGGLDKSVGRKCFISECSFVKCKSQYHGGMRFYDSLSPSSLLSSQFYLSDGVNHEEEQL
jgi:hypothetical protein